MKLKINARELWNGYVWTKDILRVYYEGGVYFIQTPDFKQGFERIGDLKQEIRMHLRIIEQYKD